MYRNIRPGKTWYDDCGRRIQAHGGSLLFADGKFWWYGENKEGITGRATGEVCPFWHHGVRLYSSDDLYNWKDEGFCVRESNDPSNPFHPTRIMDRPHVLYNEKTKKYVLWAKTSAGGFDTCSFSVCVGDGLKDMTFLKEVFPKNHHAGDFDLFVLGGKGYIVYENPHDSMVCQTLSEDFTDLTDETSVHLRAECPPFVREAPAFFERDGKYYLLTSGTTGYYPNPSELVEISSPHGEWGKPFPACLGDEKGNSFHAQFSSVFRHPFKKDLYVALGDRWLTDLPEDMPDIGRAFYGFFSPTARKTIDESELPSLTDENTSEADYVWLPLSFDEKGTPFLSWKRLWSTDEYEDL